MKQATQKAAQKEKQDKSCIHCTYLKAESCIIAGVFPPGRPVFMKIPVTSCECEKVQRSMIELAAPVEQTKDLLNNRDMLLFPVDVVNLAVCHGQFFEEKVVP